MKIFVYEVQFGKCLRKYFKKVEEINVFNVFNILFFRFYRDGKDGLFKLHIRSLNKMQNQHDYKRFFGLRELSEKDLNKMEKLLNER